MFKKIAVGILGVSIIFGAGTYTLAQVKEGTILNFQQMKPIMKKMHPNFSTEELEKMYKFCHENEGMMQNNNSNNF